LRRFGNEDSIHSIFEQFVKMALSRLIQQQIVEEEAHRIMHTLTQIAACPVISLVVTLRALVHAISDAYVSLVETRHPKLQDLQELWPSESIPNRADGSVPHVPQAQVHHESNNLWTPESVLFQAGKLDWNSWSTRKQQQQQQKARSAELHVRNFAPRLILAKQRQEKADNGTEALRQELIATLKARKALEVDIEQIVSRRMQLLATLHAKQRIKKI